MLRSFRGHTLKGKQNSMTFPWLFFIFQGLNFFPILYKTTHKNALFFKRKLQSGNRKKGTLFFFYSDSGDKNQDYRTNE